MSQDAVSSVVGTILLVAITVTVFAGVSIVVQSQVSEDTSTYDGRIEIIHSGSNWTVLHQGGEPVPESARISYTVDGVRQEQDLTLILQGISGGSSFTNGERICVQGTAAGCLHDDSVAIDDVQLVYANTLIAARSTGSAGGGAGTGSSSTSSSSGGGGTPNLLVTNAVTVPGSPVGNAQFQVQATVQTQTASAASNTVRFAVTSGPSVNVVMPATTAGQSSTVTGSFTLPAGNYQITVTADITGVVTETNEADNAYQFNVAVTGSYSGDPYVDANGNGVYDPGETTIGVGDFLNGVYDANGEDIVVPAEAGPINYNGNFRIDDADIITIEADLNGQVVILNAQEIRFLSDSIVTNNLNVEADHIYVQVDNFQFGTWDTDSETLTIEDSALVGDKFEPDATQSLTIRGSTLQLTDNVDIKDVPTVLVEDTAWTVTNNFQIDNADSITFTGGSVTARRAILDDGSISLTNTPFSLSEEFTATGTTFTASGSNIQSRSGTITATTASVSGMTWTMTETGTFQISGDTTISSFTGSARYWHVFGDQIQVSSSSFQAVEDVRFDADEDLSLSSVTATGRRGYFLADDTCTFTGGTITTADLLTITCTDGITATSVTWDATQSYADILLTATNGPIVTTQSDIDAGDQLTYEARLTIDVRNSILESANNQMRLDVNQGGGSINVGGTSFQRSGGQSQNADARPNGGNAPTIIGTPAFGGIN